MAPRNSIILSLVYAACRAGSTTASLVSAVVAAVGTGAVAATYSCSSYYALLFLIPGIF